MDEKTTKPFGIEGAPGKKALVDARGRRYEPAVGPRLKVLLFTIFGAVAILGATGVYLLAVDLLEKARARTYTNQFTLWMFMAHVLLGVLIVLPFLYFGFAHLVSARHRKNRVAVRLGIALFVTSIIVGLTGVVLIQVQDSVTLFGMTLRLPQLPTDSLARSVSYLLHALAPLIAVALYVLHRRAGPDIQWRWGVAWGLGVGVFVAAMAAMHSQDPRKWYARGSPEGDRYFEPSKTRTVDGNFIPEASLMMDDYCLKCHKDVYDGWFHSAHHFSSFNNPPYLFSVRETRRVSLERDGEVRASRWCAGCHDPVPFLSGQFDDKNYDDVHHPTAHAGITCTVCHAIVNVNSRTGNGDYTIEEPLHYPFAYSANPVLQWLNNQLVKAKPDFHKKTFLKPFHKSEAFCSTCHKVSLPNALNHYEGKEWLRGQNHNDPYWLSGVSGHGARSFYYPPVAKTNCAQCHMPLSPSSDFGSKDFDDSGVRKIHNHLFPGANTGLFSLLGRDPGLSDHAAGFRNAVQAEADFLRGTDPHGADSKLRVDIFGLKPGGTIDDKLIAPLRPNLPELTPGKTFLVEVVIRTLGLGHPFTQGTADSNEVWLDFTARSGDRTIGRSGALDQGEDKGRVDEWAHFINILMLDRDGRRIDRRNPQDIFTPLYDHQIPPGAAQVVHYRLQVPADSQAPIELTVRLRYRKFDYTYMEKVYGAGNVPELPIVDLCADRVMLPVAGASRDSTATPGPASPVPAWERWNDYGIGCFLEGGADSKRGELRQAERAFRQMLTLPDALGHAHAYLNLGRVYYAQGRLEQAAEVLNKARTNEPPAPWWTVAWFTGLVNAQNGHLDEAIADFEQILDPTKQPRDRKFDFSKDYVVINELAKTLFQRSQIEQDRLSERDQYLRRAVALLRQTLEIDPENLDAHYWLTQCFSRLGELMPAALETVGPPVADDDSLLALGRSFSDGGNPASERISAAAQLCRGLVALGRRPTDPKKPKLPVLQALDDQCWPVYLRTNETNLQATAARVLGCVHREAHAIYRPDDNAQDRAIALYRRDHPAAAHASQAIVIYPLNPTEKIAKN